MNRWVKRLLLAGLCASPVAVAFADFPFTNGSGNTMFAFICQTTKVCLAHALIDQTGNPAGVSGNPIIVQPSGNVNQPITGSVAVSSGTVAATQSGPWKQTINQGGFDAQVSSTGRLLVDAGGTGGGGGGGGGAVTQSGTWIMGQGAASSIAGNNWPVTIKNGANAAAVDGSGAIRVVNPGTQTIGGSVSITGQPISVTTAAQATGGCIPGHFLSAANANATPVKSGAGTLCELVAINTGTTAVDLRLYNVAGTPNCASATGVVANYPVQPNTIGPGFAVPLGPWGKAFTTGIGICLSGGNADDDNSPAVTGINVNYAFK